MDHGNPAIDGGHGLVLLRRARDVRRRDRPRHGRRAGPRGAGARRPDRGDARGRLAGPRRRGARALGHRPARMGMKRSVLGWLAVAGMAGAAASPASWIRRPSRTATVVRALMPWATVPALPLAIAAVAAGRRRSLPRPRAPSPWPARRWPSRSPSAVRSRPWRRGSHRSRSSTPTCSTTTSTRATSAACCARGRRRRHVQRVHLEPCVAPALLRSRRGLPASRRATAPSLQRHRALEPVSGTSSGRRPAPPPHRRRRRRAPGGYVRIVVIHTQSPIVHHRRWLEDLRASPP